MLTRFACAALAGLGLLAACESRRPAEPPTTARPAAPDSVATPAAPVAPDTVDISQGTHGYREGRDTTFLVGGQPYRLLLRADVDSTKPLITVSEGVVGGAFAHDTSTFAQDGKVRGYQGGHTITLLDPKGRQVFRRRLRKQDFFGVASRDVVTVSDPQRPRFIGYHAPSQALAFSLDIGIPASDVWQECVLVLGFDGRVRRLATVFESNWYSADCVPRLLPDGTVLACQALLRADGQKISLLKPKSELMAAFPLNDSLLLTMYRYGEYRARLATDSSGVSTDVSAGFNDPEWVPDRRLRAAPNAFVVDTRGRVRRGFRFANFAGAITTEVPRRYLWQAGQYYLLDDDGSLLVIDKRQPAAVQRVRRAQMQRFRKPRQPHEARFELSTEVGTMAFYVDPAQPTRLRYQRIEPRD